MGTDVGQTGREAGKARVVHKGDGREKPIGVEKFNCTYSRSDVSQILRLSPRVPYVHSFDALLPSRNRPSRSLLSFIFHSLYARAMEN